MNGSSEREVIREKKKYNYTQLTLANMLRVLTDC